MTGFDVLPGEYVEVTINGVTYSSRNGDVIIDQHNGTWSVQIPDQNSLAKGVYDVEAVLKRADGTVVVSDNSYNELEIRPKEVLVVRADGGSGVENEKATGITLDENGKWLIFSNQNILESTATNNSNIGDFSVTKLTSQGGASENQVGAGTWMDYNRDGYMDFFGEDNSHADGQQAFLNNGNGTYTALQVGADNNVNGVGQNNTGANTFVSYGGVIAFDKTGNGYGDLIYGDRAPGNSECAGGYDSQIVLNVNGTLRGMVKDRYYVDSGSSSSPNRYQSNPDIEVSGVDLNNDGTVDMVYHGEAGENHIGAGSTGRSSTNASRLVVGSNQGNNSWSVTQIIEDVFQQTPCDPDISNGISMTWADYNGDGYMDLFLGRGNGETAADQYVSRILFNDGNGNLMSTSPNGVGTATGVYMFKDTQAGGASLAVDWNHDGKMDIIELPGMGNGGGMTASKNVGPVNLYTNNSTAASPDFVSSNLLGGNKTIGAKANPVTGAVTADVDWDGAKDLLVFTQQGETTFVHNENAVDRGTALHFKILDQQGINALFGNTVQLFDSRGNLVASQILNPQSGNQTNDSSAIVDFYGLDANETYSVVLLRNINGNSADIGGLASLGGNRIENVNASWTGLKAGEANAAYVLTAEAGTNSANANINNGVVGTGYNDTIFATRGTDAYNGGGGTVIEGGEKVWSDIGGMDIVDYKLAGSQALNINLNQTSYQSTGYNTAKFINIEGIYGANGNDTFIGNSADNIFDGRGGNDTFRLNNGGKDTLLYQLLDDNDGRGGNGHDTVHGFTVGAYETAANADRIDVSDLLVGYQADADGPAHYINGVATIDAGDAIADYLSVTQQGGNTVLSIDRDGQSGAFASQEILTLVDTQVDLATLLANHQILV